MDTEHWEESAIEKCPLYICVYICSFLSATTDGGNVRAVSRKWASAIQQLDLLNIYLAFDNAECINIYLSPMFEHMFALANFPIQLDTVVDQIAAIVKETTDGNPLCPHPLQMVKQKDGMWNFVFENCKLFYKTNPTKWIYESYWFRQQLCAKSDTANSDIDDDDNDPDFEEDDGFRYNYYGDDDEPGMSRYNDKGAEEDMGDVGYYSSYPDESAREIAKTRDELGYLNLHNND